MRYKVVRVIGFAVFIAILTSLVLYGQSTDVSCGRNLKKDSSQILIERVFYISSTDGNDSNNGLSPDSAWKSLNKVNSTSFCSGDKILFKSGSQFTGRLHLKNSGSLGAPIVIDMYGDGSKPRIDAEGLFDEALLLENVEYWEVNNLELTNTGIERDYDRVGVRIRIEDFGTAHHIYLRNLYVHDVNGSNVKRKGKSGSGGISWWNGGEKIRSRFDGLLIENCRIERTDRDGIKGWSTYSQRSKWYPSLNVVIRKNTLEDIGGDGIVPIGCDGCIVEYNTLRKGGQRFPISEAAAGIWPWSCDNTVIQYNEVSEFAGSRDAQGFDSDYNCRNSLFQYNYSHDNEGGFMLICTPTGWGGIGNKGTVIRYNISQNDGFHKVGREREIAPSTFYITGPCQNTYIYNNVIYIGKNQDIEIIRFFNWERWDGKIKGKWPVDTIFYNNIFYVEGKARITLGESVNNVFKNNVFYGNISNIPNDPTNLFQTGPLLINPGSGSDGLNSLKGYKLREDSPCIDSGIEIENNGGLDFWGNKVLKGESPSIGAYEFN